MSMRPVDLQTVVPRVAEAARVDRVAQQEQEKTAAETASQNREAARKGNEEIAQTKAAEQRQVAWRKDGGGKERRPLRRGQGRGAREGADEQGEAGAGETGEGSGGDGVVAADDRTAGPGPDEPGQKLDIRV